MKKLYPLLSVLFLIYWGCEDPKEEDTEKPITITSPQDGSTVYEIVTITCMSSDNEGVDKVELWVNGVTTGLTDNSEPYSFDWNTTLVDNGNYTITIRSYDTSDNTTDSEPVVLTVDNTLSLPTPVILYPITYNDGFQISWSQNNDDDFQSYKLYESLSEDMSNDTLIYETDNRTDTTYLITIEILKYYQITIEDYWGLQSTSNVEVGDYEVELWGEYYSVLNTTVLDLSDNELTGSIPPEIGVLTNLTYLNLRREQYPYTSLTGSIPPEIGNLTNLIYLDLSWNGLTGSIPSEIGNLTNLTQLGLYGNRLTGEIPPEIWNLTNLTELNLGDNRLTGSIPPEIGNLTNLTYLRLSSNQFTGSIPPEIGNLTNLTFLSLGDDYWELGGFTSNQLTGSTPPEIGNLTNLTWLDLGSNQLTGEIPSEIGNLTNLTRLRLYDNQLTGSIPSEISNLNNLTQLWLENNQLTGEIPESICDLDIDWGGWGKFNISNNQLCPPYPSCIENDVGTQDTSDCD
jgi:Leucine-rich repeat (LRR) protein